MIAFFAGLTTVEAVKAAYRDLAKTHHPDLGGDAETMKALNSAYHATLQGLNGAESEGRRYTYRSATEQAIMDKIAELLKVPGLEISLIGFWVWVHGDTRPVKDTLKAQGCRWHAKRVCWYWKPEGFRCTRANPGSLETLAAKYGCEAFRSQDRLALA